MLDTLNYHVNTHMYLLKEFDVLSETSVLLLEAAQDLISQLTDMLLQWIAAIQTLPEAKRKKGGRRQFIFDAYIIISTLIEVCP